MRRLLDWYWQEGKARPKAWRLPEIGVGQMMEAVRRFEQVAKARGEMQRGCVAFWGPSQAGKSSLLSHYLDAMDAQGSALTWRAGERVRFSADPTGGDREGVVFNPFRGGMDASAVVTRFYLPTDPEAVKPEVPVEVVLAERQQVLHALALGYHLECRRTDEAWDSIALRERLAEPSVKADREAFELLYEVCEICEALEPELSRFAPFRERATIRRRILSSNYVDDVQQAWVLAKWLLWDGNEQISMLLERLLQMRTSLVQNFLGPGRRFLVSMRVAALLEDIGVMEFAESGSTTAAGWAPGGAAEIQGKAKALQSLQMVKHESGAYLFVDGEMSFGNEARHFDARYFGLLQALVGEMRIPIRPTLNAVAKPFLSFLEHFNLLDIPGVTNKATGDAQGSANLLDLSEAIEETVLLRRVYKSGKTLAVVHGQAAQGSIDSFVVFVDLEHAGGLPRPGTLTNGIKAWLRPFGGEGFSLPLPLPLYLNCSLFGKLQDKVAAAIQSGGLQDYCRKAEALEFVKRGCAEVVFTSSCFVPWQNVEVKTMLEADASFRQCFLRGRAEESLNAVVGDGLGTDYLFARLTQEVSPQIRWEHYNRIEAKCRETLRRIVAQQLPSGSGERALACREAVRQVLARLQTLGLSPENSEVTKQFSNFIKRVFVVDAAELEPLPTQPHLLSSGELKQYLTRQIVAWVGQRKATLSGEAAVTWLLSEEQLPLFLQAVATIDLERWTQWLQEVFWQHNQKVSRVFLAMALNNAFLWGDYARKRMAMGQGSAYEMLCAPFVARLEQLAQCTPVQADGRPTTLPGDASLAALQGALGLK